MKCPDCGHNNISGVDACADCGQDLTSLDTPGARTDFETSLTQSPVSTLAPLEPIFIGAQASVREAIDCLRQRRVGAVLVGSPDALLGIFTERDVLLRIAHCYEDTMDTHVSEFMTADIQTVEFDAPIAFALHLMSVGDFRHLPVTRADRVVGVISLRDVVSFLSETYPDLIPAH